MSDAQVSRMGTVVEKWRAMRIWGWLQRKETRLDDWMIDRFEFVVQGAGKLVIRPKASRLDFRWIQQVCRRLMESKELLVSEIQFDFSRVKELIGSWSVHFALLIRLSKSIAARVSLTGLQGQPASAAWIYRDTPALCGLLGVGAPRTAVGAAA